MSRMPRRELIEEPVVGIYHCVQRAVRRAFLCGQDAVTGRNFDHRKAWIQDRLEFLAGYFGIEVLSFAVMSNHAHVILRNRPDVVEGWSAEEVARRWWFLFPARKDAAGQPEEPTAADLQMLTADGERLADRRRRLSSLSWFMRCLAEPIARQANREDGCTGRFWEGRFKCQRLLDEAAVLACSVYVDLNPIRAGIATTPETSQFTSAYERIQTVEPSPFTGTDGSGRLEQTGDDCGCAAPDRDSWLSPVELQLEAKPGVAAAPSRRASDKGFLPVSLSEYLRLVDWTGRQARPDKRGQIPAELAPILTRLQLSAETWVDTVLNFGRWFKRAAGRAESLTAEASRRGRHWLHGLCHSRTAFA